MTDNTDHNDPQQLWGGRFSEQSDEEMRLLNDSLRFDRVLYGVDIAGSIAYAWALNRAGILSHVEAQKLEQGLEDILKEFEREEFEFTEGDEDIHTAVERRLTELVGDVAGKLHSGRSRNDQVATDTRLWLRDACQFTVRLLRDVQTALVVTAKPHLKSVMPGYTHMQPAQPITAAHWLMSFFWMLERDISRLNDCANRLNVSPLGASALAGTPYPIDRELLAADLGFGAVTQNSLDAVSDRDGIAEFLFCASMISVHLSRLAEDVIYYSNPIFGFITLPDAFSTGSSIMPQKRNADPMELTRGKSGRIIGNLTGILTTLKGLPSGYNKDLQEDKEPLFDTLNTLVLILPVIAKMIAAFKLNPLQMRAALDEGMLATEIADWLVLKKQVPFREAHHLVGAVVKAAEAQNVTLSTLPLATYRQISAHFDEDVYAVLDFDAAIEKRKAIGGTSPAAVAAQIEHAERLLGLK